MGNQEIKAAFSEVLSKTFPQANASNLREQYLPSCFKECNESQAKAFFSAISNTALSPDSDEGRYLSAAMRKCFPYNSCIDFESAEQREDLWDQQARDLWQIGYTGWQHNLATLQGDAYKNIVMGQNTNAARYEFIFNARSMMLCSNFMLRFQGGAEVKDIQTYFRETFDQGSNDFGFVTSAQTIFLGMMQGLVDNVLQNPENFSKAIEALIMATNGITDGSLFSRDAQGMQIDLLFKRIRCIILTAIRSNELKDDKLKAQCIELLMRMGCASANPEDLILAAQFQFEFKIDISRHLDFFLKQSELFEEPKLEDEDEEEADDDQFKKTEKKRIQNRCSYEGNGSDRQHPQDKMCCDGQSFFSFANDRGLTRANKKDDGGWEHQKTNGTEDIKKLKRPTFLVHGEELYLRHEGAADVPFQRLSKSELTFPEQEPIVPAEGQVNRFKWTTEEDPPIEKEGIGKRWMKVAPMASDSKFIYTLVFYREGDASSTRKAIFCEIYELKDNKIEFKSDFQLFKTEGNPWIPKNVTEEGGYLDFGLLTCNGKQLIWSSPRNYHIFNVKDGIRIKKQNVHSGKHLTMFDRVSCNWYTCDADCYSWLDEWKIKGFKMFTIVDFEGEEEGDMTLPAIPVVLDDPKARIIKNRVKDKQPAFQLNLFAQLIGGQMEVQADQDTVESYKTERGKILTEIQEKKEQATEEDQKKQEEIDAMKEDNWIYDYTRAIILSHCSKIAQERDFIARKQTKQMNGKELLKFFKEMYGIQVSEGIFTSLRLAVQNVLKDYDMTTAHISERFTLKALLHIYISHIGCMRPLKISIRQIMSSEEMQAQQQLIEQLKKVELFPGQKKNPDASEVLTESSCFQLHIYHLAQQAVNEMENLISTKTVAQKLDDLLQQLNGFMNVENDPEIARVLKRYQGGEFLEIYDQPEEALGKFQEIFSVVLNLIESRLIKRIKSMFDDKWHIDDDFQGYGSEETQRLCEFAYTAIYELMITVGTAKKALLENQPNKDAGEDEAQQEAKKARILADETAKLERINDMIYEVMIQTCKRMKSIMKLISKSMLSSKFIEFNDDDYTKLFNKLDMLTTGKASLLKAIETFIMTIQLYEVGSTDLDEVSEALRDAVEGLQYYSAASETLHSLNEHVVEANKNLYQDIVNSQRFVAFALSKVACRLVNGESETAEPSPLSKFTILRNGISEKFIPKLSDYCKKEIEGSFKITADETLRQSALASPNSVEYSEQDRDLIKIMGADQEFIQMLSLLKDGYEAAKRQAAEVSDVASQASAQVNENQEKMDELVRHCFASMVQFQNLFSDLSTAQEKEQLSEIPESIRHAWETANKLRSWESKVLDQLKLDLKQSVIDEFKKDYAEENPSKPALEGKLSDEHQKEVDVKIKEKAKIELQNSLTDAIKKCKFMVMFETKVEKPKVDDQSIDHKNHTTLWDQWSPTHARNARNRTQVDHNEEEDEKSKKIQDELIDIIQDYKVTSKILQDFTEQGQIKGLRRLAGLVMFNKTFESNDKLIFYDALHMFEASLRGNQAKLNHYLDGVPGCGARTEREIRKQFFESIKLIAQMIRRESDQQLLVNLLNALLWDYQAEDMQVLAQAQVFRTLSGDAEYSYAKYNTIYNAWGMEERCYSIENRDKNATENLEYSLSARLRQCFDYLTMKVYSVVYSADDKFQTNQKLNVICTTLMERIQEIVFSKFERHLNMLQANAPRASVERDEDIRFDNQAGEKPDSPDAFMQDQCDLYGNNCIQKVADEVKNKKDAKLKIINKFLAQPDENKAMDAGMANDGAQEFKFAGSNELDDALLRREWRVLNWAANFQMLEESLGVTAPEEEKKEEEKKEEKKDKLGEMKEAVNCKNKEDEKIEEWISQIKEQEGEENPRSKSQVFSKVSIIRMLKPVFLMISLAESSRESANLLLQVFHPKNLNVLVRLQTLGSSQAQCIVQKIFQILLRCGVKLDKLNAAVTSAISDDTTGRVRELARAQCDSINLRKSSFWTYNFNQIYMTRCAQYSTTIQVEVGKPAVVEEVIRTFATVQMQTQEDCNGEHSKLIRDQVMLSLKDIERRTDVEIATLFSLVPESHTPLISTGKRCLDVESGDEFICLGFAQADKEHIYDTRLSMVQMRNAQVIGLIINKGNQQTQNQKSYSLMNVIMVPDIDVAERIQGQQTLDLVKKENKRLTKASSIYMNPEIVSQLLSRMTSKDSIMRNQPEKAITQQFLQIYILNGIFRMLEIFEKEYLIVLKSYNQLETLINFLAKEAANQMIKPDEHLVSATMLQQLSSEVYMSSTHTSRSTGYYAKVFIYIEEESKSGAFLQRLTDDSNQSSEFMDINVVSSFGDNNREPAKNEEGHELSTVYGGGENEAIINCKECKLSMNSIQKAAQKKTGYMRCLESTSDAFYCNECRPNPQVKRNMGLDAALSSINTLSIFRNARNEAVFIKSEDLIQMTDTMLTMMVNSNVIITNKSEQHSLCNILEALAKKIEHDNKWKFCGTCRFIVVENEDFEKASLFIKGERVNQSAQSRGTLLTKICSKVEIAQKRVNKADATHAFVTKFLQEKSQPYNEFLNQTVENILREEIAKDFGEEVKEKQREEKKMQDQLKTLNDPSQLESSESIRNSQRSIVNPRDGEKAPDFMFKFTEHSNKLIQEGGKEFFNPVKIIHESSEYRNRFDEIVFESDTRNPGELQRRQLRSCLSKVNQILARQIWLRLMSEVTDGIDADTKNIINATAMHPKICDLIHDSNMSASYQNIYFGDKGQQKIVQTQITKLLRYFDQQPEGNKFVSFFVKDFLKRADMTIDQARKDNYTELSSYKLKDLRKVSKLPNVFDPNNLLFLSKQIFKLEKFLTGNIKTEMAKVIFDLHLGFAILFKSEQDAIISQELVKGCSWALDELIVNIETFCSNPTSVNGLLRSDMIIELFKFMDQNEENTNKKKLFNEIIIKLNKIFNSTKKRNPDNSPQETPFKRTDKTQTMLDGYNALEHGRKFSSMMPRIKLLTLLNSPYQSQVSQYGQVFQTERKMFKTFYKKTFTPQHPILISIDQMTTKQAISVQKTSDMKSIIVDATTFAQGKPNSMKIDANEEVTIEFPVAINEVKMSGRMMVRNADDVKHENFLPIEGTEQISATQVYSRHHHAMFVSSDEQVMGMGFRACGKEDGAHKLKLLERPEACTGYKKVCAGKFFRLILTNEGRLFFCGQNKKYMCGKEIEVNQMVDKFYEIKDLFPMASDDKIIDVDGGKHFMIVVTEKGKVFTSGYMMYRAVDQIRQNSQDNEDFPCELKMTQDETVGWKPIQCWACDLYCNVWILAEKDGQKKIFAAGGDYDMVGCADGNAAPKWRAPVFPEGTYMKVLASEGMSAYGIDQDDNLWEWGDHKVTNTGDTVLWEKPDGYEAKRSTPYKFVWFNNNNKKPIRIASGKSWALCQVEHIGEDDNKGKIELYGWAENVTDGRFGQDTKVIYNEKFVLLGNSISHADVVDFDCSREATYLVLQKAVQILPSILEDQPESRQLVHFYKNKGKWVYVEEKDWAMNMDKAPPIIYATRHPIKNWDTIKDDPAIIPDLDVLKTRAQVLKANQPFNGLLTTNEKKPINGALYYARYKIDGQIKDLVCTLDEVKQGGQNFDLQPLLFYVIKGPILDHMSLPPIDNQAVFYQSEQDNEFLRFSITNQQYDPDEIMAIQVNDQAFNQQFDKLSNFDKDADFDLLRCIDRRIKSIGADAIIKDLRETQFDASVFPMASNSPLKKLDIDLIQNRSNLLFSFSKSVDALLPDTFFEENVSENSIASKIKDCQTLLLPSVKIRFFKNQLQEYWSNRNTSISCPFRYNRKEAYEFMKRGVKENTNWISASTFGQLYQICKLRDAEFSMMQNTGNSFDINQIEQSEYQEGDIEEDSSSAFAFRMIETELMSDQLPLFIKTPNGRHQAGNKRDCFNVNPRMTNPEWMKCYSFIGALIGRVMVKDHLWFGVPMAPTFWMLVQDSETPTLEDFAKEDARLRKRLNKFEQAQKDNMWPDDETWVWINSEDKVLPIDASQPQKHLSQETVDDLCERDPINRDNYEEFREKLLERLVGESQEQVKHVKHGIKQSLGDFDYMRQYLNWHDLMVLAETDKYKEYEGEGITLFKEQTIYMNCQADDEWVKKFWDIYTALSYEDKKIYLNFVSGKSRLGDKKHRYPMSHRIRVESSMAEGDTPQSKPSQFELILAPTYASADQMKQKLLEAITKGCGLDPEE